MIFYMKKKLAPQTNLVTLHNAAGDADGRTRGTVIPRAAEALACDAAA